MPKAYVPHDHWSRRAESEGYRARSVYKLMELQEKFRLLKPKMTVLDVGAAPGSWLQFAAKKVGPEGKAIGVDLTPIEPVAENVHTYVQDATDTAALEKILVKENVKQLDLVLCDIAPSTSGVKDVDQWKSVELARAALAIAWKYLRPRGMAVTKVFRGSDFDLFLRELREQWDDVKVVTVKASRDRSREVYLIVQKH